MAQHAKTALILGFVALAAACGRGNVNDAAVEEFVVMDPEPITAEPEFTGKYK